MLTRGPRCSRSAANWLSIMSNMSSQPVIQTGDLTKHYGDIVGIEGLTLTVQEGEVFGLLGPNGSGKTTTIRLLLDLIRPTRGRATVLGLDAQHDTQQIHARIGILPGELALYPDMTGEQFLRFLANLRGGIDWHHIEQLVERLDCDMSMPIKELSSGNKHKVGLIQALMHHPDLLILDEPTTGLDPLIQQEFYKLVREMREAGRTVFLSSHDLHEVELICSRVGIIRQGELIAVESLADLKTRSERQVEIIFDGPVPVDTLKSLPSVHSLTHTNGRAQFVVEGPFDPVLTAVQGHQIKDLIAAGPDLEHVFLQYYREQEDVS